MRPTRLTGRRRVVTAALFAARPIGQLALGALVAASLVACAEEDDHRVSAPELYVVDHLTAGMACNRQSGPPGAVDQPESESNTNTGEGSGEMSGGGGPPCGGEVNAGGVSGGAFFGGGIATGCGEGGSPGGGGGGLQTGGGGWSLPEGGGGGDPGEHPGQGGLGGGGESGLGDGAGGGGASIDLQFEDDFVVLPDNGLDGLCCYVEHCPDGVSPECPFVCGDGEVHPDFETCDGDCDSIVCDPGEACDALISTGRAGRPSLCNVFCSLDLRNCVDGDGCCPTENGCNYVNDADCPEPTGEIGSPCVTDDDCGDHLCFTQEMGFLGGYCSPNPIELGTCPDETALTLLPDSLGTAYCPTICDDDSACREDGYACYSPLIDDYEVSVCARYAEGDAELGEACEGYWDCAGGADVLCTLGRCVQYCDEELGAYEAGCPGESYCQGDQCRLPCTTCFHGDGCCPSFEETGFTCTEELDLDCAIPETEVGAPCTTDADCGVDEGIRCLDEAEWGYPGGFCTVELGFERVECPEGSEFSFAESRSGERLTMCGIPCTADAECRDDYVCWSAPLQVEHCSPAPIGTAELEEACTATIDCGGDRWTYCDGDYCRYDCTSGNDCPAGWGCGGSSCRPTCDDGTCPGDMVCITLDATDQHLCY